MVSVLVSADLTHFPLHFSTVFDICIRGLTQHGRGARTKDNGSMEDDDGLTQTTADPNVMDDDDCSDQQNDMDFSGERRRPRLAMSSDTYYYLTNMDTIHERPQSGDDMAANRRHQEK